MDIADHLLKRRVPLVFPKTNWGRVSFGRVSFGRHRVDQKQEDRIKSDSIVTAGQVQHSLFDVLLCVGENYTQLYFAILCYILYKDAF